MAIKSDRWIREQATNHGMISPFSEKQVREGVISYGLSSYGYDLRVSDEFKIFTNVNSAIIDPKAFDERSFVTVEAESVIVPPNSFALARSIEYFKIPRDVLTICVGKSTYARCGIIVNVTPFEPEWEGYVTRWRSLIRLPLPAKVYANEGLCQILFFQSDEACEVSYADRAREVPESARHCLTEAVNSVFSPELSDQQPWAESRASAWRVCSRSYDSVMVEHDVEEPYGATPIRDCYLRSVALSWAEDDVPGRERHRPCGDGRGHDLSGKEHGDDRRRCELYRSPV